MKFDSERIWCFYSLDTNNIAIKTFWHYSQIIIPRPLHHRFQHSTNKLYGWWCISSACFCVYTYWVLAGCLLSIGCFVVIHHVQCWYFCCCSNKHIVAITTLWMAGLCRMYIVHSHFNLWSVEHYMQRRREHTWTSSMKKNIRMVCILFFTYGRYWEGLWVNNFRTQGIWLVCGYVPVRFVFCVIDGNVVAPSICGAILFLFNYHYENKQSLRVGLLVWQFCNAARGRQEKINNVLRACNIHVFIFWIPW